MFTKWQLEVIPLELQSVFVALTGKGMRPTKAASKLGITLSQHHSQLLSAKIDSLDFAATEDDITKIYADTQKGQSCMTSHADSPAYVYSRIGAQVAYNDGSRAVVNPITKQFGRIYGEKSSDLYYSLLALGYTESPSPLAGLSGMLDTITQKETVSWYVDRYSFEWSEGAYAYIEGDYLQRGEIIRHGGEMWRVAGYQYIGNDGFTRIVRVKRIVKSGIKVVYKAPRRFYLDGDHRLYVRQGKLVVTGEGSPSFVQFGELPKVIPEYTVFRKNEKKTVWDSATEFEARLNKWKH